MAHGGEKALILAVMLQAIRDASGRKVGNDCKAKTQRETRSAQRFVAGRVFDECCKFVGGDVHVIRQQLAADSAGVLKRAQRGQKIGGEECEDEFA